jgi:N6-adenosine-specific RNA methylase IME4
MDRTGRVNGVFKRLKVAQQAERIRGEPPPMPTRGPYRVGVVDIAWASEPEGDADRAARRGYWPYPTLNIAQASAVPIDTLMHDDAIIWMWVTNFILVRGLYLPVLRAWKFEPKTILTWVKTSNFGNGDWLRGQSEHCVMAARGRAIVTLTNESTVLFAPTTRHSAKPKEFYDLVERLCPAPRYVDVFSRYRHNDKWDCYGDEAPLPLDTASTEAAP